MTPRSNVRTPLYLEILEGRALPGHALASSPLGLLMGAQGPLAAITADAWLDGLLPEPGRTQARASYGEPGTVSRPAGPVEPAFQDPLDRLAFTTASATIPAAVHSSDAIAIDILNAIGTETEPTIDGLSLLPNATYLFNDSFEAEQNWAWPLAHVNPLGRNHFETAMVFGEERRVYRLEGTEAQNAGLHVDTTGIVWPNVYTLELVFEFVEEREGWRRIADGSGGESDEGFYVNPDNYLNVYPEEIGYREFATNAFHHVVLTNEGGPVQVYMNGSWEFWVPSTTAMNIENEDNILNLFLDDRSVPGEYADARIALLRLYHGALSAGDVAALAENPFAYP
jgi:concanavalin A-like lectin/glucanase superfamily protein